MLSMGKEENPDPFLEISADVNLTKTLTILPRKRLVNNLKKIVGEITNNELFKIISK